MRKFLGDQTSFVGQNWEEYFYVFTIVLLATEHEIVCCVQRTDNLKLRVCVEGCYSRGSQSESSDPHQGRKNAREVTVMV